jgi:Ca-activated chloride channel family protein
MPNTGETRRGGLFGIMEDNAANATYSTFIGMGVDFNTELIEHITKVRGANYYSVHSPSEFRERMDEGFEFMVTPLVFGLELTVNSPGYVIEEVYGSPEANEATGEIMKVNTLFPSLTSGGETKGGLVLLKLKRVGVAGHLQLSVRYEDREGVVSNNTETFTMTSALPESFDNSGIRKGVLLARYADLLKNWLVDERTAIAGGGEVDPSVTDEDGIVVPYVLGEWERQSVPLQVSMHYRHLFEEFGFHFDAEMAAIGDENLEQEMDILALLAAYDGPAED